MQILKSTSFIVLLCGALCNIFADAGVRIDAGAIPNPHFFNTTNRPWQLGGFRIWTDTYHWANVNMLGATVVMSERTLNGKIETEGRFHRNNQQSVIKLTVTNDWAPISFQWVSNGEAALTDPPYEPYILLKTGSSGDPDDPDDEDPITVDQIDSLLALPNFYNPDYRWLDFLNQPYYDSLGVNGGKYSGGFMDTYLGETQILLPLDSTEFSVNMTPVIFDPYGSNASLIYMMTLAMGQEYFHVDMQWQLGFGAKETFTGVTGGGANYIGVNTDGAYGCFEVESPTGVDRAIAYPKFYPRYAAQLASAQDVASSGINTTSFMGYYCGVSSTPINSAFVVNSFVISAMVQYANYDFYAYAEDLCWKETLADCIDPYVGIGAMAPTYNIGIYVGGAQCAALLDVNNYQSLLNDPLARDRFPEGNNNYRPHILEVIQTLIDAARRSMTDLSIAMYDEQISQDELIRFFFGDGGSVATQGDGGLLLHFYPDDQTQTRQEIYNTLLAAFDKLKGKAPSTAGTENISFRYDFLTVLRTVKGYFDCSRDRPGGGDVVTQINNYSKVGGCSQSGLDENYPYMAFGTGTMNGNDFVLPVNATDNKNVGIVKWTTDFNWIWWKEGTYLGGTNTNQNYEIRVPDATAGDDLWISVTDSSGNTIVRKTHVTGGPDYPTLDSAIIEDTHGNGWGDKITICLTKGTGDAPDELSEYQNLKYSWPTQTNLIDADIANVTVGNYSLAIADNTITDGAGLGKVAFDYPSATSSYAGDMLDRIGPAIDSSNGVGAVYNIPGVSGVPDTLYITFTEKIKENLSANTAYLNFKIGNNTPVATVSTEASLISGTRWMFIFPAGTVGDKDSVNIVHTSGVVDTVNNPPLSINQFVPLKKIGNKEPRWGIGYIRDTRGDGMGDKITITIQTGTSDSAYQPGDCEEIRYSWPQKGNFTTATVADPNVAIFSKSFIIDDNTTSGEGEGNAELDFPESIMIKGDIIDSVGPALINAVLLEKENTGDPDTLVVTFTEPVAENLAANHQYLNVNGTAVTSLTADKEDNASMVWRFSFAANTVKEGDKVNLIHNSGLIDQAFYPADDKHNPPLSNNQEVVVILLKGTYKVVDGKYLDVDGEGTMDSIVMTMNKSVKQVDLDTMTFTFTWLASNGSPVTMTVDGSAFNIFEGVKIGWKVTGYTLKQYVTSKGAAWGQATITQPNEKTGTMETSDITISDGMGAVIYEADYYSFNSISVSDTLIVYFSEDMSGISEKHPFKFWTSADPEYLVEVSEVLNDSNKVTFYVVNFTDNITPSSGDSIWIYAGNNVNDAQGVEQSVVNNIKRPLSVYNAYSIVSAVYLETDARPDGFIDLIRVRMNAVPDAFIFTDLAANIALPGHRSFAALTAASFTATADGFEVRVSQSGVDPNTAVDDNDIFKVTQGTKIGNSVIVLAGEVPIADSLAPVATRGLFRPALIGPDNVDDDVPDTLEVTFSEKIEVPSTSSSAWPEPFLFHTVISEQFSMEMESQLITQAAGKVMVFKVDTVLKDSRQYFPITGDSLWVQAQTGIKDMNPVTQSLATRPVPLIVMPYEYVFDIVVYPNPFGAGEKMVEKAQVWNSSDGYNISATLEDAGAPAENDMAVLLIPFGYVNNPDSISAEMSVFDAVGNLLLEQVPLNYNKHESKQAWCAVWDTRNKYGRFVGQGTYLCIVTVRNGIGVKPKKYKTVIGIKNNK